MWSLIFLPVMGFLRLFDEERDLGERFFFDLFDFFRFLSFFSFPLSDSKSLPLSGPEPELEDRLKLLVRFRDL